MTFIHGYLLGGLLLAGVPILLHLILRPRPKRLPFPAFRFLKARQRTNQRKLRLQHLVLLVLRVLVLAALCLALARPRIFSSRLAFTHDRPVAAVLLIDTSPSMEYTAGGRSRLDDARQRAGELLDEMDPASRVAVLDSGDDGPDVLLPVAEARSRLESLRIRPSAGSLNRAVDRAVGLLRELPDSAEDPPRLLYVFSDRTRACWDASGGKPVLPAGVTALFVDVGVEKPRDLAIERVDIVPAVVPPGGRFEIRVRVRGTPGGHDNELSCQIDNDPNADRPPDRQPVGLGKDQTGEVFVFERKAPATPAGGPLDVPFQVTARLGTRDALLFNNTRHATFLVRGSRKLLTLVDKDKSVARVWQAFHAANRSFAPDLLTLDEAGKLTAKDLAGYAVIALFQVKNLSEDWARKLSAYVNAGGGLAIVPGGAEVDRVGFNDRLASVLPAPLDDLADTPPGKPLSWDRFTGSHPLMAPFVKWSRGVDPDFDRPDLRPFVRRYWRLGKLAKDALSIASYADADRSPSLAERAINRGKVVQFTSPLDVRFIDQRRQLQWNNYLESSFLLVLVDQVCRYLAGEAVAPELNFRCGETVQVPVTGAFEPPLSVNGPGLAGAERNLRLPVAGMVQVPQAITPGNYQLADSRGRVPAAFSLDVPWAESDLERIQAEELEGVFGPASLIEVGRSPSLREALAAGRPPPVELLPYLMFLLLCVLTAESLLSNRFYRRTPAQEAT